MELQSNINTSEFVLESWNDFQKVMLLKSKVYRPARSDCQTSNKSVERPRKNENAKNEQAAHLIVNLRFLSRIKNESFVVDQDDTRDAVEKVVDQEKKRPSTKHWLLTHHIVQPLLVTKYVSPQEAGNLDFILMGDTLISS